jgi:hypothetical protein
MYKIVRMYLRDPGMNRTVKSGLTMEEAQSHCSDPETSWKTCKLSRNRKRTKQRGPWFDGWEECTR